MHYFRFAKYVVILIIFYPISAIALCLSCDEVVELNSTYAACFLDRFDEMLNHVEDTNAKTIRIEFNNCNGVELDGSRGNLGLLPDPSKSPTTTKPNIKSVYKLETSSLICLQELVRNHSGSFDPSVKFDLYETCK